MTHYGNDAPPPRFTQAGVARRIDMSNVNNGGEMLRTGRLTKQSDTFKISYLPERNEFPSLPSLDHDGVVRGCVCGSVCVS